jgi:hypothetical protein
MVYTHMQRRLRPVVQGAHQPTRTVSSLFNSCSFVDLFIEVKLKLINQAY